ncbi:MAG: DNA polymerase III subunit delta [Bdellovibrionales bacterium]
MKVAFRDIKNFVQNPPSNVAVILVYGPDYGLMKERIETIGSKLVPDLSDPFNVADLDMEGLEDVSVIIDEANTVSMMGDNRLVRIRSGADKLTATLKTYLKDPNPNATILIEAGELTPRSTLRKLCETDKNAAALPCYVEEARDLSGLISQKLDAEGYTIDRDANIWLSENLSGDHGRAKSEIEKLILYKGKNDGTKITLMDAMQSSGLAGAQSMDDLVYNVADRNIKGALKSLESLTQDGIPAVAVLRGLQNHFRKLLQVRTLIDSGANPVEALGSLTPPLFFKVKDRFAAQVRSWNTPLLYETLETLSNIEANTKSSGYNPDTLVGQFIASLQMKQSA